MPNLQNVTRWTHPQHYAGFSPDASCSPRAADPRNPLPGVHTMQAPQTYSLAEIRNGTGWPADVRFTIAPPPPPPGPGNAP